MLHQCMDTSHVLQYVFLQGKQIVRVLMSKVYLPENYEAQHLQNNTSGFAHLIGPGHHPDA